jgi:hypothetical protein
MVSGMLVFSTHDRSAVIPAMTTLQAVRRFLLVILLVGMGGTAIELLLLKHDEGKLQLIPLVLLGLGLAVVVWHAVRPGRVSAGMVRTTMVALAAAGVAGVYLHYGANREFQLEGDPSLSGRALLMKVLEAKVPPALAPGVMVQLGLIGLAYTYRYKEQ